MLTRTDGQTDRQADEQNCYISVLTRDKNHDFRPQSLFISEMMQHRAVVTMEGEYETAPNLSNDMANNDFQYGGWNSYTLQCGMWLWNRDHEFTKWQHPCSVALALG